MLNLLLMFSWGMEPQKNDIVALILLPRKVIPQTRYIYQSMFPFLYLCQTSQEQPIHSPTTISLPISHSSSSVPSLPPPLVHPSVEQPLVSSCPPLPILSFGTIPPQHVTSNSFSSAQFFYSHHDYT